LGYSGVNIIEEFLFCLKRVEVKEIKGFSFEKNMSLSWVNFNDLKEKFGNQLEFLLEEFNKSFE
jgi:hypothetical protein